MSENVVGAKPSELVASLKTKEGSLSFTYSKSDFIANSIGHVMAIPTTHLTLLTFKNIFQNPEPAMVEHLKERWKDVPWKGDVLVRVGHNSLFGDIQRIFANDKIRGPLSFNFGDRKIAKVVRMMLRLLILPSMIFTSLKAKLFRADYYNPFTNTVNIFHPNPALGMHETGHAEFFNQERRGTLYALFSAVPIIKSFTEYKATLLGVARMKNDEERRKNLRVLEAAWGTYLMRDIMVLTLPFLAASPLATALTATKVISLPFGPSILKKLSEFGWTAGMVAGAASGHLLSRMPYPGQRQRFGYIFSGEADTSPNPLKPRQMLVATARPH